MLPKSRLPSYSMRQNRYQFFGWPPCRRLCFLLLYELIMLVDKYHHRRLLALATQWWLRTGILNLSRLSHCQLIGTPKNGRLKAATPSAHEVLLEKRSGRKSFTTNRYQGQAL